MNFGKLLWALIKKRGYSMRQYSQLIDMDCGNLCKLINGKLKPPKSQRHVWGMIGPVIPTDEEVNELMCAAYEVHAQNLKVKWGQITPTMTAPRGEGVGE